MRRYKKLYVDETLKNTELKNLIDELEKQINGKNVEPYSVCVYFDKKGETCAYINNVVKHEVGYRHYPDCSPENWKITTADGLVSVFKYDEVKYIIAYRKVNYE